MAAPIEGEVIRAYHFQRPHGAEHTHTVGGLEYETEGCFVDVIFPAGWYLDAFKAKFSPQAMIQQKKRDGKLPLLVGATCAGAGDESGTIVSALVTGVADSFVIVGLLKEDLATPHDDGNMSSNWPKSMPFFLWYRQLVEG